MMRKPYLLQQPATLQCVAINNITAWVMRHAPSLVTPAAAALRAAAPVPADHALRQLILIIRNYFYNNLPKEFHDVILSNTMTQLHKYLGRRYMLSNEERKVIWRLADAFYTDHLTSLSLPYADDTQDILQNSLCDKSQMLTSLTRLQISCRKNSYPTEFEFIQLLRLLHSLKHLTIPYVCTNNILRCIVTNCNLIEELDISSSIEVDNSSARSLIGLPYLSSINLRNTSVKSEGIEAILLSCKEITTIQSNVSLKNILKDIAESDEKFPKLFKLSTYTSFRDTVEELELVVQMCPLIKSLDIQPPRLHRGGRPNSRSRIVMAITGLMHLRQLKLTGFAFHRDKINEVLQIIGSNLEQLYLDRVEELDMISFVTLSETCPNLQSISIIDCKYANQTSIYYELKDPLFGNIKNVFITDCQIIKPLARLRRSPPESQSCYIQELAFFLLSRCPNVESIEIRNTVWLTEDFMLKLLDKNPLTCLEVLRIDEKPSEAVTKLVIDKMIESCSRRPQIILV